MAAVDTTVNWNLDYEQLPGCRVNLHAFRFFSCHPNEAGTYVLSHPSRGAFIYRSGKQTDLLTPQGTVPAANPATTSPLFIRKKL